MALTITPINYASISTCEAIGTWVGNKVAVVSDYFKQGSNSLGFTFTTNGNNDAYLTGSWNLSSTPHLRIWLLTVVLKEMESDANGGIQFYATGGGNTGYWNISGKDSYPGGWYNMVVDMTRAVDSGSQPTLSSITTLGVRIVTNALPKNAQNIWLDNLICCDGLGCTSDTQFGLEDIYNADNASTGAWGVIRKIGGVFFLTGSLRFNDSSGSGSCDFKDTNQIAVFEDRKVNSSLYAFNVTGNATGTTSFQLGDVTGSGSNAIGSSGITISTQGTKTWQLSATGGYINNFKLYANTLINTTPVELGSTSTALGASGKTIELIDNNFNSPSQVVRNIASASTINQLRNKISFATDSVASMDLYAGADTPSSEWQIIGTSASGYGRGFRSTQAGTQTINVLNHNFNQMYKPYITIAADETWNSINPNWTIVTSGQAELDFLNATSNQVNEKYTLEIIVQETDGTKLQNAYTYVYEGLVNLDLPADNRQATDVNGLATSDILSATYVDNGGTALTKTAYGNFALKVYKYTYSPFVTSLGASLSAQIDQSVTLLDDSAISQSDQATAIAGGSGITVTQSVANPNSLITYSVGSGTLSATNTITGSPSGASGTVVEISDGDSTAGKTFLNSRNGTAFANGDSLSNGAGWTATYTSDSEKRFTWEVDCVTKSIQVTYDYLAAKMAEATPDSIFLDVMIWGQATRGQLMYSGASGFYTVRNNSQGVFLSKRGAGTIAYFTANDGTTWAPSVATALEVNGVKTGSEPTNYVRCYIETTTGGPETPGTILMSEYADQSYGSEGFYKATQPYTYTSDQPVKIRARYKGYLPFEALGTITSAGLIVTAIWQTDSNYQA